MLIRARSVLPMTAPSVEDGAVLVSRDRIEAVGRFVDLKGLDPTVVDLGEVVVLPGLINCHCHLDYTHMLGMFPPTDRFPEWIRSMLTARAGWGEGNFKASWIDGARQLLESGTTTVANIESVPGMISACRSATPLRVFSFIEMTGVRSQRAPESILDEAVDLIRSLGGGRGGGGLSPHAPYSTLPALLEMTAARARTEGIRTTTHVAESLSEFDMYMNRCGPMFSWLEPLRPMTDCGMVSPLQHLRRCGLLGSNHLAVHVNHLGQGDVECLSQTGTHVVHCPSSHRYFCHPRFSHESLSRAGVNVTLGTDSLASTPLVGGRALNLSLLVELRQFLSIHQTVSPLEGLEMVTTRGARALGLEGLAGELRRGGWADLVAIPYAGPPSKVLEAVIHHSDRVAASLIAGEWAIPPGGHVG